MGVGADIPQGLIAALREARHVCVLTGAGVSAESGVPTFREAQSGLWAKYDPLTLATPEAFRDDPALVWRWYRWRRDLLSGVAPNPGHLALSRLADLVPTFTLITQNVDGLHQRGGSEDVIEFHGNIFDNRCFSAACERRVDSVPDDGVPVCPSCGGNLRPGVVWFGESIPAAAMEAASGAVETCDLFFSIGTSSLVWPAAGFVEMAQRRGAGVIEINPQETATSAACDYRLAAKSGLVLPKLIDCLTANEKNV